MDPSDDDFLRQIVLGDKLNIRKFKIIDGLQILRRIGFQENRILDRN